MRQEACGLAFVLIGASVHAAPARAQSSPPADAKAASPGPDIIVKGKRGSAIAEIAPVAVFDRRTIEATGASTIAELLRAIRAVTQAADGGEPIFLLNAQRVSGYQDIGTLPPEAIDKVEVLPEPAALKLGYPPTRRVVNFITKRRFQQTELRAAAGAATRGGSARGSGNLGLTRLRDDSRLTLGLEIRHTETVRQSDRAIRPYPDILFDRIGNVVGVGRGEIDPALSAAAGAFVTVAPVPAAPADRATLAGYAAAANRPRLFDLGPYRTLTPRNDAFKADAVLADRIGASLAGSLSLSAEQSRDRSRGGLPTAILTVPPGGPFSPFTRPALLYRYLAEADPLRLRQTTTTLHAGGTLRGAIAGWRWDVTAAFDQQRIGGTSDRGVDLAAANAAIAAGADPFAPLPAAVLASRLVDRARLRTRTTGAKAVVTNTPIPLPAGDVAVTLTIEAERASASAFTRGTDPYDFALGRTRTEAGIALDIPIASARKQVLPVLGELSVNAAATARHVGGARGLRDRSYGVTWTPRPGVQLLALDRRSAAAPGLTPLSTPTVRIADVPVFDFVTGRTDLVTLIQGGNPALLPERRHARSLALNLKPFATREWRIAATFEATTIRNQTGTVYATTASSQAALPDLFVRDAAGRLVSLTFRPINFARERLRVLNVTAAASGSIGAAPPPAATPGATARERPSYYAGIGPSVKFSDRLNLRADTPALDLLHGDTVTGGALPRVYGYAYGGLNYRGNAATFDVWYGGGSRISNAIPAANLAYAPIVRLNMGVSLALQSVLRRQDWARKLQLKLDVANLTDGRQQVRDGTGATPNRFQPGYIDPIGRTLTLTLRKLF